MVKTKCRIMILTNRDSNYDKVIPILEEVMEKEKDLITYTSLSSVDTQRLYKRAWYWRLQKINVNNIVNEDIVKNLEHYKNYVYCNHSAAIQDSDLEIIYIKQLS